MIQSEESLPNKKLLMKFSLRNEKVNLSNNFKKLFGKRGTHLLLKLRLIYISLLTKSI